MPRTRFVWRLYPSFLSILILGAVLSAWVATTSVSRLGQSQLEASLRRRCELAARELSKGTFSKDATRLAAWCDDFSRQVAVDLAVVSSDGRPLWQTGGASRWDRGLEIDAALAGKSVTDVRHDAARRRRMMYAAMPVMLDGGARGAVRVGATTDDIEQAARDAQLKIAILTLVLAVAAWFVGWWVSRRTTSELDAVRARIDAAASGRTDGALARHELEETAAISEALDELLDRTSRRLDAVVRQNNEQRAVLASMLEGVLAVDTEHRVISLNRAGSRLLGAHLEDAQGRNLQEVVRNVELRKFVADALAADAAIEGDIVFRSARDRILQANGTSLRDSQGASIGAVIVLNDVTRLRQLETLRRDFAANVSHELKTPITSIKGFVETLLDGALTNVADAERFLRIVSRQADRLNAIIDDLLSLAKIEREGETEDIALALAPLREVLATAMHDCEPTAAARDVRIALECPEDLRARINAPLLRQAVANLLDNAIKYSEASSEVRIEAGRQGNDTFIRVRDQGCGVAEEHLPRLFERFYRADKARSRKLGGTGLGLAIVKHIALAHRGGVSVESALGEGSVFTITLPTA